MISNKMAISFQRAQLPRTLLTGLYNDLTLAAKGLKSKTYKPKVTQLIAFDDTLGDSIAIPIQYGRNKFKIEGMGNLNQGEMTTKPPEFRPGQKEVFMEALKHLGESKSVFLQLHCGWGKTWLALQVIAAIRTRTIILVHRRFLAKQFITESENVIPGQVQWIEDSNVDENTKGMVFICTEDRALKLPHSFVKTINFIVVDEAKYWCTPKRLKALLVFRPKLTMGLCAERERKDGFHTLLDMFFGPNIFRKSKKPFTVWKYMTQFEPKIEPNQYGRGINWTVAMQSLSENEQRNIIIRDICRLFKKEKIMVLVQYVDHLETLQKLLVAAGEDVGTFYSNKDSYVNCRILLATYGKAEMGFDDANLCEYFDGKRLNLLILGSFYKKEIEQSAGRVLRSEAPQIIDVVDKNNTLKKHSKTRDVWFRSRNGKVMPPEYIF